MRRIQTASCVLEFSPEREQIKYDPRLCKTCQKLGYKQPRAARTVYSDCEEHFRARIRRLLLTGGVKIISK
ncbi:MAG TPA: hypothetical protein VFF30_00585 [Nitrososphaerales archaeon]|nr:hypothetical protein [Nitrososphaerales archaeon]